MKRDHERRRRHGRANPGQVYLESARGDPATHPALRLIALAERETAVRAAYDVAREHDRALSDGEVASWRLGDGDGRCHSERAKRARNLGGFNQIPRFARDDTRS